MFRLLLFSIFMHFGSCSCPSGFDLVKDGECRGYYGAATASISQAFNQAISYCNTIQGQPVIIHNQEQQDYWSSLYDSDRYINLIDLDKDCTTGCAWYFGSTNGFWYKYCADDLVIVKFYCTTQLHPPVGASAENWQDAKKTCRTFGAELASVHNQQENSFIRRLAVSKGKVDGLYLGGTIAGKGNSFGWVDGSEWNYDNFYPGFPIDGLGACLAMDTDGTSGQWVNVDCSMPLSVACGRQEKNSTASICSSGPYKEGDIMHSPGFPFNASIPCDMIISVETGKKVLAEIYLLEANSCCDRLILYDNYIGGSVIANLTGEINDKLYTTKLSNFMRVSWQPNGGVNVRGLMMTFKAV